MGSILTNMGAMVALQTLRTTQKGLTQTQNAMSTGKKVADARDNSATWAIGATLQYDVDGFQAIQDNLNSAKAAVDLALTGANSIVTTLNTIRGKLVDAQGATADFTKINNEVTALKAQIDNYVSGASYYGVNLLNSATGFSVITSLSRTSGNAVTASSLAVTGQNLSTTAGTTVNGVFTAVNATAVTSTIAAYSAYAATLASTASTAASTAVNALGTTPTLTNASAQSIAGLTTTYTTTPADTDTGEITASAASVQFGAVSVGNTYTIELGINGTNNTFNYVAQSGDTVTNVATALRSQITAKLSSSVIATTNNVNTATTPVASTGTLNIVNITSDAITLNASVLSAGAGNLSTLSTVSASSLANANSSLAALDTALTKATSAASTLGTYSNRLQQQSDFTSKMQDSLKAGISALTDADMEATAARLQALQVQQQLGTQALSIANAQPQVLLSLFKNG